MPMPMPMTDDVQLLVTHKLFAPGDLEHMWSWIGGYDYDAHARCDLVLPPQTTACALVSITFRDAFRRWKQAEILCASHALVRYAVNVAVRMCNIVTYPAGAQGLPCSSFLDVSLRLQNRELFAVRCVREGKLLEHSLNAVVRKPGHQSCTWNTLTREECWDLSLRISDEAQHDLEQWQHSQRVALVNWLRAELKLSPWTFPRNQSLAP